MKYLKFIPIVALFILACNTVEDDNADVPAAPTDVDGNVITTVDPQTIIAMDSINFRTLLTDSVSKRWNTLVFTLAGSNAFTACRLDDIMVMFANGNYTYQGGQLCGAEDNVAVRNGSWEIDYTNKLIIFDKGTGNQYEAEVIGLDEDELRVKGSYMGMEVRGLYAKN